MSKKALGVASGILAALGAVSLGLHFFAVPAAVAGEGITVAYDYSTKVLDGMPEELDQEITKDGQTYVLPADWQSGTQITLNNTSHHYSMFKEFSDLTSQQAPETLDTQLGGKIITLTLESADYTPTTKDYSAKSDIEYTVAKDEIPQKADITYENEEGNKVTVPGTLVDITAKGGSTGTSSQLYSTIAMWPDVNAYMVGETVVGYDPISPRFDGYEKIVAEAAGLPAGTKVVGGVWDGDTYIEDGMVKRDIIWYIQKPGTESVWIGHYVAEGTMTTYDAKATYGVSLDGLGLSDELATEVLYNYSAEVPYVSEAANASNPLSGIVSVNHNIFLYIGIACLVLAVILLVLSILLGFKGKEYYSDDDNDDHRDNNIGGGSDGSDFVLDLDAGDDDTAQFAQSIENSILNGPEQ